MNTEYFSRRHYIPVIRFLSTYDGTPISGTKQASPNGGGEGGGPSSHTFQ